MKLDHAAMIILTVLTMSYASAEIMNNAEGNKPGTPGSTSAPTTVIDENGNLKVVPKAITKPQAPNGNNAMPNPPVTPAQNNDSTSIVAPNQSK